MRTVLPIINIKSRQILDLSALLLHSYTKGVGAVGEEHYGHLETKLRRATSVFFPINVAFLSGWLAILLTGHLVTVTPGCLARGCSPGWTGGGAEADRSTIQRVLKREG